MTLQFESVVKADIARLTPLIESRLLTPLSEGEAPKLKDSMVYSLSAGGKRIRPILCLLATESLGEPIELAVSSAVALEYIHTYSLIHDDLPAMDDDDLRRGKPTNHKVFGEGHAILAGDGLLTEAFCILAMDQGLDSDRRVEAIKVLSQAAGWRGMVGGQSLDLEGEVLVEAGKPYDYEHLKLIHRLKTGALLQASLEMGAVVGGATSNIRGILKEAGSALGLAFQIKDDILDATSTSETMGKRVGKDEVKGKITFPKLLGLDGSKNALIKATEQAIMLLGQLPNPNSLVAWARYLAERTK